MSDTTDPDIADELDDIAENLARYTPDENAEKLREAATVIREYQELVATLDNEIADGEPE